MLSQAINALAGGPEPALRRWRGACACTVISECVYPTSCPWIRHFGGAPAAPFCQTGELSSAACRHEGHFIGQTPNGYGNSKDPSEGCHPIDSRSRAASPRTASLGVEWALSDRQIVAARRVSWIFDALPASKVRVDHHLWDLPARPRRDGGLSRSGRGTSDTREAPAPAQWKECLRWVCRTRSQTGFRF